MREDIKKVLEEIKVVLEKKHSISESELQNIFVKNELGIKEITIISEILDNNNIQVTEDINSKEEPSFNEIEEIDKEDKNIEEDSDLLLVKKIVSNYIKLDEDDYFELANIIKHSKNTKEARKELKKWFDENNININQNKIDEIFSNDSSNRRTDEYINTTDPVRMYLKEIGKIDLLSPKKEKELAKKIYDLSESLENMDKYTKEYKDTFNEYINARNKFAEHNLRLVVSIAKHYIGRGIDFIDLIQEGNMGLQRAIEKYDYTKGFKFSTYATWWIRQSITRAIDDQVTTIRIPVHLREKINKLKRITDDLKVQLQRTPTNREIIEVYYPNLLSNLEEELGRVPKEIDIKKEIERCNKEISYMQKIARENELVSLDSPVRADEDEDSTLLDFIPDENQKATEEQAFQSSLRKDLNNLFENLTIRERITLLMRYGLYDGVITDEEKEAIATKLVINNMPEEDREKFEKLNSELNNLGDINPINQKIEGINTYKDYLDKKSKFINQYKSRDYYSYINREKDNYEKAIKVITDYNIIFSNTTKTPESSMKNNLNVTTYLALKQKYEELYNQAYFVLTHGNHRTLENVGELFDVTRERVRQIEARGIRKLRQPSRAIKIKDYVEPKRLKLKK